VWLNVAWFHICIHCQGSLQVFFLLQASPEQSKKQAEDADRAMNKIKTNRQAEQETAPEPKERDGSEAEVAEAKVCSGIAALVRKTKQKSAGRAIKDTLLQASPEEIKKKQEDADRVMMEILEEEQEAAVAAAAVSQKKKQAKEGKERRNVDRQVGIKKVEQGEEQSDDSETEKNKTENVAAVEVAAGLKDKAEEQEWDGDDGLLNESSALMAKQAREAGAPAAGVGVEAGSWPSPLQANVEVAAITMSAAAAEAELLFMSKFNFSSGEAGEKEAGVEAGASGVGENVFESIDTECKVCMHAPKSHLFVPCGHMCVCSSCASLIMANTKMCPICCTPASHVIKLFL